jgi:hypothetical protein
MQFSRKPELISEKDKKAFNSFKRSSSDHIFEDNVSIPSGAILFLVEYQEQFYILAFSLTILMHTQCSPERLAS